VPTFWIECGRQRFDEPRRLARRIGVNPRIEQNVSFGVVTDEVAAGNRVIDREACSLILPILRDGGARLDILSNRRIREVLT